MLLANYVSVFENTTVDSAISPLLGKYGVMLLDFSDVNGSGRIEIVGAK